MTKLIIDFDATGNATLDVQDPTGATCDKARAIEKALGKTTENKDKPEHHRHTQQTQRNAEQS